MAEIIVTGRVKFIGEMVTRGTFSSREIVVTTEEQYPQHINIQFAQDKCDLLDKYSIGQPVDIAVNLRGKEWVNPQGETKYFNTIQGWKINAVAGSAAPQSPATPAAPSAPAAAPPKTYKHTDATIPLDRYLATPGWTYDVLVAQGKGVWETGVPVAAVDDNDGLPF